jgi:hypothetical protein
LKNLLNEDDFKSPNTPEHRILRNLKKELDTDYQSNFTMDNQTLMVSFRGKKVEIDIEKIGNHDYQYTFHDSSNGQEFNVGDVVRVEGDDTDVNEVLRLIFSGQISPNDTAGTTNNNTLKYKLGDPRYGTDDPRSLDELEKVIIKHMKVKERGDGNIKVNNEINIVYLIYKNKGGKKSKKTLEAIARN